MEEFNSSVRFVAGTDITVAIKKALKLSIEKDSIVNFSFNGINFLICPYNTEDEILRIYNDLRKIESVKYKT